MMSYMLSLNKNGGNGNGATFCSRGAASCIFMMV